MPPHHSVSLTQNFHKEREDRSHDSILTHASLMLQPERHRDLSPHLWVFWCKNTEDHADLFDTIARGIQRIKERGFEGSTRQIRVYEGHRHTLQDFLDLPDDDSISLVHEAHRLRGRVSEAHFKGFQKLFESKYKSNQIAFLSRGPFLRELPDMTHAQISKGKQVTNWFWPPDEPGQIVTTKTYEKPLTTEEVATLFSSGC